MKELLSGNEALARGALEAGIEIACGYPGTPSSEILENVAKYKKSIRNGPSNEKSPWTPPRARPLGTPLDGHDQAGRDERPFRLPVLHGLHGRERLV